MNHLRQEIIAGKLAASDCSSRTQSIPAVTQARGVRTDLNTPLIQNILVLVDSSKSSQAALRYAGLFAERFGGKIIVTYIVMPNAPLISVEDVRREIMTVTGLIRDQIRAIFIRPGVIDCRQIIEEAAYETADLIVISANLHMKPGRFFQSSPLENMIRRTPCPVVVVSDLAGKYDSKTQKNSGGL